MRRLNLRGRAPNELAAGESAVAADAKRVRNAVADAKLDADQSGAAACESPISGVAQTSNAIGQIIDIADKIASQANGSAFESSVEKACVREARRRVAIVAAEMRSRSALGAGFFHQAADVLGEGRSLTCSANGRAGVGRQSLGRPGRRHLGRRSFDERQFQ
jgi:hypothetical protein